MTPTPLLARLIAAVSGTPGRIVSMVGSDVRRFAGRRAAFQEVEA